jgi:hypothetical protein
MCLQAPSADLSQRLHAELTENPLAFIDALVPLAQQRALSLRPAVHAGTCTEAEQYEATVWVNFLRAAEPEGS